MKSYLWRSLAAASILHASVYPALSSPSQTSIDSANPLPTINIKTQLSLQQRDLLDTRDLLRLVSIDNKQEWLNLINQIKTQQTRLFVGSRKSQLKSLVEEALSNNPQLDIAYKSIQSQDALLASAKREWNPTASATAAVGYGWQTLYNIPLNQPSPTKQASPVSTYTSNSQINSGINISWFPYLSTRQPLIRSQASALDQQRFLFIVTARDVILDTQLAYTAVQKGIELIKAYSDIVETDIAIVDQIEKNKSAGLSSQADVEQQKAQLYQDLISLIVAYSNLDAAQAQLIKSVGLTSQQYIIPEDAFVPTGQWEMSFQDTVDRAISLREEIKASVSLAESLNWNAKKILALYLPSFSLTAGVTSALSNGIIAQELWGLSPSYNKQSTTSPSIYANVTWNFYDGGSNRSLAKSQQLLAAQALDTAQYQRTQITADAATSFTDFKNSSLSTLSAQNAVRAARNATAIYRVRYSLGVDTITPLVLSIKSLSDATASLATSVETYNNSVNRLYRNTSTWPSYIGLTLLDVLNIQQRKAK